MGEQDHAGDDELVLYRLSLSSFGQSILPKEGDG
jgi:hypothetical protein